ncbi:hypothetical protein ROLI_047200 (plasmid) [Roseobacter fucihabitans]|uniref:Uncharacterized protein n=1 Tax=Roseobacter fucihabitans TaxID=1537242 RepID=A0ABZ2C015_9RHOB|nr:hypothetical protein [Roseobacter litoralis]
MLRPPVRIGLVTVIHRAKFDRLVQVLGSKSMIFATTSYDPKNKAVEVLHIS